MSRTSITRRQALSAGLLAVGGVAISSALPALRLIGVPALEPAPQLTYETFAAQLGTQFRVNTGPLLRLASVRRLQAPDHPGQPASTGQGFVLEFEGATPLASATYKVEHARLGTFEMFLSPVGMPGPVATAEAVFNRLWS